MTGEWSTAQTRPALTGRRGRVVLSPSLRRPLLLQTTHRDSRRVQPTETLHHHNHLACSAIPACCCWRPLCVEGGYTWLTERAQPSGRALLPGVLPPGLAPPPPPGLPPPLAFHNHNNPTTHTAMNTSSNQERRRGTPAEHQQQHAQRQQQHAGIAEQARWLWWCNVSVG